MSVTRGAGNGHKNLGLRHDAGVVQRRSFGAPAVGVAERRDTTEAAPVSYTHLTLPTKA